MPVDGRHLRAITTKGAIVVAARQRFAFDPIALDGRKEGRTAVQPHVVGDASVLRLGALVLDAETDGRARRVETVVTEGLDDVLVDHHQRQGLPATIILRDQQVVRRHLDGLGERREAVRLDGRRNLLSNLVGNSDVALGRNHLAVRHPVDRTLTGAVADGKLRLRWFDGREAREVEVRVHRESV